MPAGGVKVRMVKASCRFVGAATCRAHVLAKESLHEYPAAMEDQPSPNGGDGQRAEPGAAMQKVVQQLVRSIAGSARARAEAAAVLNGQDGADRDDTPSPDGGNGRGPDRGRG